MEDDSERSDADENVATSKMDEIQNAREPSPEMARISALITRPPKQKSSKQRKCMSSQIEFELKFSKKNAKVSSVLIPCLFVIWKRF